MIIRFIYREHRIKRLRQQLGLSLCIQGTYCPVKIISIIRRFIPVYTGNMKNAIVNALRKRGLSLCIQGTSRGNCVCVPVTRFIPVYTGNIQFLIKPKVQATVYPCVYREHLRLKRQLSSADGLSLCIQGTSLHSAQIRPIRRFIPVCTGNIPIITYCFIIKILTVKFLPIF